MPLNEIHLAESVECNWDEHPLNLFASLSSNNERSESEVKRMSANL
jgi:hypothetical protein